MITGGSSMAALRRGSGQAMIFKAPPQFGQCRGIVVAPDYIVGCVSFP